MKILLASNQLLFGWGQVKYSLMSNISFSMKLNLLMYNKVSSVFAICWLQSPHLLPIPNILRICSFFTILTWDSMWSSYTFMVSPNCSQSMIRFLVRKIQITLFLHSLLGINYGWCCYRKFGQRLSVVISVQKVWSLMKWWRIYQVRLVLVDSLLLMKSKVVWHWKIIWQHLWNTVRQAAQSFYVQNNRKLKV